MDKIIFFQSSLPRAGSTIFQNIMGQNPSIHPTPTSGISHLVEGSVSSFSSNIEFKTDKNYKLCKEALYNYCREGINGYYSTITSKPIILDKGRSWLSMVDIINQIYKPLKIITLVRDLRSILISFEKQYLNNPEAKYVIQEEINSNNITFLDRISYYENLPMFIGFLNILKNIIDLKNPYNIHIIKFEDLCTNPSLILKNVYNYLNIDHFKHNFNDIKQITYENDNFHILGDHTIMPKLQSPNYNTSQLLTPEVEDYIYQKYNWFFTYFNYTK